MLTRIRSGWGQFFAMLQQRLCMHCTFFVRDRNLKESGEALNGALPEARLGFGYAWCAFCSESMAIGSLVGRDCGTRGLRLDAPRRHRSLRRRRSDA
jgi:hypothetical protein